MPFDPDAYLASKKTFDPDAYLASKKPASEPAAPAPKPPREATLRDYLSVPRDVLTSAVSGAVAAPIADVAGLAATGYEVLRGGKGDGDMPGRFRESVRDKLTFHPNNPLLTRAKQELSPVGEAVGSVADAVKSAAKGDSADNQPRGMAVNAGAEALKQGLGFAGLKGAPKVPGVIERVRGVPAVTARNEALTATKGALSDVERSHAGTQATRMAEAQSYEDVAARTQRDLDAARQRTGVPGSQVIGDTMRSAYESVIDAAKAARAEAVDPLYKKATEQAKLREATGARIEVKPALGDLDAMIENSQHIPDLNAKLLRLRQSIEPAPTKGVAPPSIVDVSGRPLTKPLQQGLTYEQLAEASRYIKDIAFSGEAEGYGALIRNTAKKLSLDLDKQISAFVPEHAEAAAMYRKMSEPMETTSTRFGRALRDTEGGLKEDAYHSIAAQDLPKRLFAKREGIEQLVDALAGGKEAAPAARAAAQAKVDTWVENWILDGARGKTGAEAGASVLTPDRRAALSGAPGAAARLDRTFTGEQAAAARIPELQAGAKESRKAADAAAGARAKIAGNMAAGDAYLAAGNSKAALAEYSAALRQNIAVADPQRYKAAIALIERADTLEHKTKLARRLAAGLAISTAGAVGGATLMKNGLAVPGAM